MELLIKSISKFISLILIANLISLTILTSVQASLITTTELLTGSTSVQLHYDDNIALQREYIQKELIAMGVETDLVINRVDSMSNIEIEELSNSIQNKEAGGNLILIGLAVVALGFVIWAYLFSRGWGSVK